MDGCKPLPAGPGPRAGPGLPDPRSAPPRRHGRAAQVDPIKFKLKAPGTQRLKPKYDKLLSSFAFKFNLRRYIMVKKGMCFQAGAYQYTRSR